MLFLDAEGVSTRSAATPAPVGGSACAHAAAVPKIPIAGLASLATRYRTLIGLVALLWFAPTILAAPARTYRILPHASTVSILVYRAGLLQSFGHNHVITSHAVDGTIQWRGSAAGAGQFFLRMPFGSLMVDPKEDRAAHGKDFASTVSDKDRAGTRRHMLGPRVLDYPHYRDVRIGGHFDADSVQAEIDLHGVRRAIRVPVEIHEMGDQLSASGHFDIQQSWFGITPFTAVGGLLRIRDRIEIEFHLLAQVGTGKGAAAIGSERDSPGAEG